MENKGVRKGVWTPEEDILLRECIHNYGVGKWHLVPLRAGLNRCRKSCRMRWLNYLNPNLKRGEFDKDEVDLIIRLHKLLGNRWSLIAGRLPNRTANDVKNFWNSYIDKKLVSDSTPNMIIAQQTAMHHGNNSTVRPQPRNLSNILHTKRSRESTQPAKIDEKLSNDKQNAPFSSPCGPDDHEPIIRWWTNLLEIGQLPDDEPGPA